MPKYLFLLAAGGLLGLGLLTITPGSVANLTAKSKVFPKTQPAKPLGPAAPVHAPQHPQTQSKSAALTNVASKAAHSLPAALKSQTGQPTTTAPRSDQSLRRAANTVQNATGIPGKIVRALGLKL